MNLTDEMILKSKNSRAVKGFAIIDENYIVIQDDFDIIEQTKKLRERGVNICGPIEFRVVDGVTYTLEHRAPGVEMSHSLKFNKMVNSADEYIDAFTKYIEVLKMISNIPEKHYLKFFNDIEEMKKEGIRPDYCHVGNLFYDKNVGFSFIDVYPNPDKEKYTLPVDRIFHIIINPKFKMRTKTSSISILPQELKEDYNKYMANICKKILTGLYQYGYPKEEIKRFIDSKCYSFSENDCLDRNEIQHRIEEKNNAKNNKIELGEI